MKLERINIGGLLEGDIPHVYCGSDLRIYNNDGIGIKISSSLKRIWFLFSQYFNKIWNYFYLFLSLVVVIHANFLFFIRQEFCVQVHERTVNSQYYLPRRFFLIFS